MELHSDVPRTIRAIVRIMHVTASIFVHAGRFFHWTFIDKE